MNDYAPIDSPTGWVAKHITSYVESGGEEGHMWRGVPTLLLTTRGRRTRQLRRTALIYGRDGEGFVVVASKGGAAKHPLWYLNLVDDPKVEIQVGSDMYVGRAATATGKHRDDLWRQMAEIWPAYDGYQEKTSRQIPVVTIHPEPLP